MSSETAGRNHRSIMLTVPSWATVLQALKELPVPHKSGHWAEFGENGLSQLTVLHPRPKSLTQTQDFLWIQSILSLILYQKRLKPSPRGQMGTRNHRRLIIQYVCLLYKQHAFISVCTEADEGECIEEGRWCFSLSVSDPTLPGLSYQEHYDISNLLNNSIIVTTQILIDAKQPSIVWYRNASKQASLPHWTGFLKGIRDHETAQEGLKWSNYKQDKLKKCSKYTQKHSLK